jgi:hypothetical protein
LEILLKEIETLKSNPVTETGELTDEATKEAQAAARKLGIVLTDDVKNVVTEILSKEFDSQYTSRRSGEKLLDEVKSLEKDIDGSDGRPKFDSEGVLNFMQQNPGFQKPQQAYEAMYPEEMAQWRVDQIMNKKKSGITTTTSVSSNKSPQSVSVTAENIHAMMSESLNSGN